MDVRTLQDIPCQIPRGQAEHPTSPRILSLSCVYPNPTEPALGLFVRSRLQHLSSIAEVKVIAPIAAADYANRQGRKVGRRGIPSHRQDGPVEVLHPAWIYPPGSGAWNGMLLAARLAPLLARLRKRYDFQILDAHFGYPDGIAAALLAASGRFPFTVTLRGNETMHARYPLRRWFLTWALRRAARVITVSEPLRDFALELGVQPHRVKVIPNGVASEVFYPRDRAECRRKLGVAPQEKLIVSAGTLIERKGHHRVVQAIEGLGPSCRLWIAGGMGREGHYEEVIRRQIVASGLQDRVRLLGEVAPPELAELMSAADVFCLASTREGWPNVLHEALSCGTPAVATRVGAVPELITSKEQGTVIPAGDPQALEAALRDALRREWDHPAIAERAQARSWERVAAEVAAEMRALADGETA